jgi:glycerate dehydrogenase
MKIVVLDGYALNPGDLSWDSLSELGETTVHDRTPADQTVARSRGAEILLTNKTVFPRDVIEALPDCRYIGEMATGFNNIDLEAARERGIVVTNVPTYATGSVAQMIFAHILNLTSHVAEHAQSVRDGDWSRSPDFCYWNFPLLELAGRTFGCIGYGRIGRAAADLAFAFGMKVLAWDPFPPAEMPEDVRLTTLEEILGESDVVSLHIPLTPETENLINAGRLAQMKPTALLINTARGPIVDGPALAEALREGRIAGAGLDVLATEPPAPDDPLLTAPNCYITPHIAWATHESRARLLHTVVENIRAFLDGHPVNVVNR